MSIGCNTSNSDLFGVTNNGLGNLFKNIDLTQALCTYEGTTLPYVGGRWAVAVPLSNDGVFCVDSTGWASTKEKNGTTNYSAAAGIDPWVIDLSTDPFVCI